MYKYETHTHCSLASACGRSTPIELVEHYHNAGYTGLVLTDHFYHGNSAVDRSLPWNEFVSAYYDAYLQAKPRAKELDFDLIFGLEHAYGSGKEMLIYGIDLEFLLNNPDLAKLSIDEVVERVHDYGGICIQAHPYRDRSYIDMSVEPRYDLVDGVEVYNSANQPFENQRALESVKEKDFIFTCGGDVHNAQTETHRFSGIVLPYRVSDEKQFVKALKEKKHKFIVNTQVVEELDPQVLV